MKTPVVLCFAFVISVVSNAFAAPTRRALVIGNDSYSGNNLQNARNDARAVSQSLTSLGYATTLTLDADRVGLSRAMDDFVNTITPGDTAVLYYAGHGLQVQGENYLVPVDFHVNDEADVKLQGYALGTVLEKLTLHGATTQVIILDACRDNPFLSSRSTRGGWAGVATSAGTFLAFGTSPGSTASDDPGDNHGLFTKSLLKYMATSPLDVEQMFQQVRQDVIHSSNGHQVPWTASSLIGSMHMIPQGDAGAPVLTGLLSSNSDASERRVRSLNRSFDAAAASAAPSNDVSMTQETLLLGQATSQLRGFKFSDAISTLQTVLSLDPRCALAFRLLGLAFHLAGRSTDAVQSLDKAIQLNSADPIAYTYRCLVLADQGDSSSPKDCQRAVELRSDLPEAHLGLAVSMALSGQSSRASSEATRAIALDPTCVIGFKLRGDLEAAQGHHGLAQQDYSRAIHLSLGDK